MRRPPDPRRLLPALALAAALAGCLDGTSTDTENTVVDHRGRVLLSNGRPAAGAVITVRARRLVAGAGGAPAWELLAADTADAQGRFRLAVARGPNAVLEAREGATPAADLFPEVFVADLGRDTSAAAWPDSLTLAASGSVRGRLAPRSGGYPADLWIGVEGTSVLARAGAPDDSGGVPFRLDGLPAGSWPLALVSPEGGGVQASGGIPAQAEVRAGAVSDVGTLPVTSPASP